MEKIRDQLRDPAACSLPAALEAMGERWSFLILRAAFKGLRHFEEMQVELGIARNVLSSRLALLVEHGILRRTTMPEDRRKIEYCLTEKGDALLPVMVALRQWGEVWETGAPALPVLVDARDLRPVARIAVHAHDGRTLEKRDLKWMMPDDLAQAAVAAAEVS